MPGLKWRLNGNVGWIPWALRLPTLLAFIFIDIAIIISLIILSARSSSNDGFATIGSQNVSSLSINWNLGLLWTALPVLVFRLLGVYWEWITNPISQRQPYVDLLKNSGAPAERSVLLDYLAIPILWRWWTAIRNRHFLVSACSFLTLVMSIVVSALSARLFAVRTVPITTEVPILFNTTFVDSAINSTVDWVPVLDTVSAILVHDGGPLGWTDQEYAFQPYHVQDPVIAGSEVTASTKAYSAYLNCSALSEYQLNLEGNRLFLTANDRGCKITQDFQVSDMQEVYFKASSMISCSADAWYSRLVFTAAEYSSDSPTNVSKVSVLSCISNYRVTSGNLITVVRGNSSSFPTVQAFQAEASDNTRPTLWRVFEQNIMSATALNPQVIWSTSVLGNLVLYYAQKLAGPQYLSTEVLERAVSDVFSAVYLTAAAQHAFTPLQAPTTSTGQVARLTDRLFTVYWIAYIIVVILVLSLCTALVAIVHVSANATVLEEEPAGLLAHAAILEKSPLLDVVTELRRRDSGRIVETATKGDLKDSRWGGVAKTSGDGWIIARLR
ncbi:hypothetical protein BKA66DRAFT_431459 [Pyrenochaeta sp. MPI-SDFR-AT-0127]|nr:hypothetical protein BKA66DRAFT_431459 [Pyrenochaeta sp. MPI-SDFR-AT-0127]